MAARPLKILRKQLESIVGPGDFRAIKQLEDLLRDVASGSLVMRSMSSSGVVIDSDDVVIADGTITVTLPLAGNSVGRPITIKNVGVGVVTVAASGSDLIDASTTYALTVPYESVTVIGGRAGLWVIA